ncbi:hypothetical protein ACWEQ7_12550 [Streptomyces sp. NPDC004069]|uniref:hypothetical protein n=1 Tax=Streptomyces sp. NPDC052043 TaxID=3365684 RepID=UPI0037D5C3FD
MCGHTALVKPEAAAKKHDRCWKCQQQWWQENEPRMKAELSAAAKAAAGRAAELLDTVPMPERLAVVRDWRVDELIPFLGLKLFGDGISQHYGGEPWQRRPRIQTSGQGRLGQRARWVLRSLSC